MSLNGIKNWLGIAASIICAAAVMSLAPGCSAGPSADDTGYVRPTVFVPTAKPPTVTPLPTPTASLNMDHLDSCDSHLKQALLTVPGPWGGHDVWDTLMERVAADNDGCVAPHWQPALADDFGRLDRILTVEVAPALQDSLGRTGRGEVRLTFAPGYLPGDGYLHWYYDVDDRLWLSGDAVAGSVSAFAAVDDLPLAVVARLQEGCWHKLRDDMLARSAHEALTPVLVADMVRRQQHDWDCQPDLWDPVTTDAGELPVYDGVSLPASISGGVGQGADGSFRMDFRMPDSPAPLHLVYLSPSLHSEPSMTTGYLGAK